MKKYCKVCGKQLYEQNRYKEMIRYDENTGEKLKPKTFVYLTCPELRECDSWHADKRMMARATGLYEHTYCLRVEVNSGGE
jgi:hypothetical protein